MAKGGYVYLICNQNNTVIYTGVTSDLLLRIQQHKNKKYPGSFTARYNCNKLVYFQFYESIVLAIQEEKRIKGGNRNQKERMIAQMNPEWKDLWEEIKNW